MRRLPLAAWVCAAFAFGCAGGLEDPSRFTGNGTLPDGGAPGAFKCANGLTATTDILPTSCAKAGCHSGSSPASGLDLSGTGLAARLVGKKASECPAEDLVPASGQAGFFEEKFSKTSPMCGSAPTSRMPSDGTQLTSAQTTCLSEWAKNLGTTGKD